jgi:hypothetical protein
MENTAQHRYEFFTDLDPLGSAKPRSYFDRKDLFNDLVPML